MRRGRDGATLRRLARAIPTPFHSKFPLQNEMRERLRIVGPAWRPAKAGRDLLAGCSDDAHRAAPFRGSALRERPRVNTQYHVANAAIQRYWQLGGAAAASQGRVPRGVRPDAVPGGEAEAAAATARASMADSVVFGTDGNLGAPRHGGWAAGPDRWPLARAFVAGATGRGGEGGASTSGGGEGAAVTGGADAMGADVSAAAAAAVGDPDADDGFLPEVNPSPVRGYRGRPKTGRQWA